MNCWPLLSLLWIRELIDPIRRTEAIRAIAINPRDAEHLRRVKFEWHVDDDDDLNDVTKYQGGLLSFQGYPLIEDRTLPRLVIQVLPLLMNPGYDEVDEGDW